MQFESADFAPDNWNTVVASFLESHILQTREWGEFKACFGWSPIYHKWFDNEGMQIGAALILQRTIPIRGLSARLRVMYVPKGPLCDWSNINNYTHMLTDLVSFARKNRAIFIKIDPDVCLGTGIPGQVDEIENPLGLQVKATLIDKGWLFSDEQIQFPNTVHLDLSPSLETLLANMKQKTRYNIRLATRKGVVVRQGSLSDLQTLYRIYAETSIRDGFVIRSQNYYQTVWSSFIRAGLATPLIAEVDGDLAAGLILFHFAGKAWFLYGMSRDVHREKMPNYLLQWEAIQKAKALGCSVYDLWGAPDVYDDSDPLWGVYKFKEGFGGVVVRNLGAWDFPVRPIYYQLYTRILPRLLDIMRLFGRRQTRRIAE